MMMSEFGVLDGVLVGGAVLLLLWSWRSRRRHLARERELRAALEQSLACVQRLDAALEASDVAHWEWHITAKRMVLSDRNYRQLGYAPGAFEPTLEAWRNLVHPDDWSDAFAAILQQQLQQVTQPANAYTSEYRMRNAKGEWRWLMARGRVVSWGRNGEPLLMVGTHFDVTERRRLHQEAAAARAETAAAAAANRAKTEFLSRMSHELRTPLNAVLGFAQLLKIGGTLGEREQGRVDAILQAGWHLLNLINDVLDIARIESGHLQLALQPMELQPVVSAALDLVHGSAEALGVSMELPPAETLAQFVRADPVRLRQCLVNLLSNAIKYNHRGGRVSLHCHSDAQGLTLQVADTGMGMSSQQMEHLFEPFNRLGRERESIEGTGIGLMLTRYLVELMGGKLEVSSHLNEGTTVSLRLLRAVATPLTEPAAQPAERAPRAVLVPAPAASVLYIEDSLANQQVVRDMLAPWPQLTLHLAKNGEQGLRLAAALRPDLILLDMRLPGIDGLQVLQRLKADPQLAHIKVVAVSASAMPEDVEGARQRGVLEYWTKPLRLEYFLDDVRRVLAQGPAAAILGTEPQHQDALP